MKLKILIGILVVLILINLGTIGTYLYYQVLRAPEEMVSPGRMGPPPEISRWLHDLNEEQKSEIREMQQALRVEIGPLVEQVRQLRKDTFGLLMQDSIPWARVEANLLQISQLHFQIEKLTLKSLISMRDKLPPEQRGKFIRFIAESSDWNRLRWGRYKKRAPFDKHQMNKLKKEDLP